MLVKEKKNINPAKAVAAIFGVLAGIGGMLHGIGEILQGNVAPTGLIIESWAVGPIAEHMDGDPAFTIVPNILITGILAITVSLAVIVWSVAFLERKRGGLILLLLSLILFLLGGGFGPPTLGILAGVAGLGIHASHAWFSSWLPMNLRTYLALSWPWIFTITVVNGIFLIVGHIILVFLFGFANADLFLFSFFFAVFSLILSMLTGVAYKIQHCMQRVD